MSTLEQKKRTVREALFPDGFLPGCTNHGCIVRKRTGVGTCGGCNCLFHLSRAQTHMLHSRLSSIIDLELQEGEE